jgi:hypothetical protein
MKKLLIGVLLLIMSSVYGQSNSEIYLKILVDDITNESDGYISQSNEDINHPEYYMYFIKFPSYYDFDLVRMVVRKVEESYSDIYFSSSWQTYKETQYICVLRWGKYDYETTDDIYFYLLYDPVENSLGLSTKRK